MKVQIEIGWEEVLREEFDKEYFIKITAFLKLEKSKGKKVRRKSYKSASEEQEKMFNSTLEKRLPTGG